MTWLTRPARLLLFRFVSRGLLVATLILLIVVNGLTYLERENYLRHIIETTQERVARLADHLAHQTPNPDTTLHEAQGADDLSPLQTRVLQETQNSGLLRLDVVDTNGSLWPPVR